MNRRLQFALLLFLAAWTRPAQAQSSIYNPVGFRDDYGGDLAVSCAGHPDKQNILSISKSGTTITIVVANPVWGVNEPIKILGTGGADDWTYPSTPNTTDSMPNVMALPTGSGPYTYQLVSLTSGSYGPILNTGTAAPGLQYVQPNPVNTAYLVGPYGNTAGLCTPEDHYFFDEFMGAACAGGAACLGTGNASPTVFTTRFGSGAAGLCNAANQLAGMFATGLNFTGFGPDTDINFNPTPGGSCSTIAPANTKLNQSNDLELDAYCSANTNAYVSQPMPNLNNATNNVFFNRDEAGSAGLGDIFSPYWVNCATIYTANSAFLNWYKSPHFSRINGPDTDGTKVPGMGGPPYFNSYTGSSGYVIDSAIEVLEASPLMTGQNQQPYATAILVAPYVFRDPQIYSKTPAASPPPTCAIATPCTLYDHLNKEYTTIAALNNATTGWNSTYTAFGSTGTQYGYTYSWINAGAHSPAPSVAGNGTTSVSTTLSGPVSTNSVQVLVALTSSPSNTTDIGFDCPSVPYQQCKITLTLSGVASVVPGVSTTYSGTITGCDTCTPTFHYSTSNTVSPSGFVPPADNGTFAYISSTPTTITLANTAGVVSTPNAGSAIINGMGLLIGPGVWKANLVIAAGEVRTDSNGNVEVVTVPGKTGSGTHPTWPTNTNCNDSGTGTDLTMEGPTTPPLTWKCVSSGLNIGPTATLPSNAPASAYNGALAAGSVINYATGGVYPAFTNALSSAYTLSFNYVQNGWCIGTGMLDECGNNIAHPWVGTNQQALIQLPGFTPSNPYNVNDEIAVGSGASASWQMVQSICGTGISASTAPTFSTVAGTTVTSASGSGSCSGGSGSVTFESVGTQAIPNSKINANQNMATDIDGNWKGELAGKYYGTYRVALNAAMPRLLYGGADVNGGYTRPPSIPVLKALALYADYMYSTPLTDPGDPNIDLKVRYVTEYFKGPIIPFTIFASFQSLYKCGAVVVNGVTCFWTQQEKANQYAGIITNMLQSATWDYNGAMPFSGMQWWGGCTPFQTYDFGFCTNLLNLYNGIENVTGSVPCTYTTGGNCGGEPPNVGVPPASTLYLSSVANAVGGSTTYTGLIKYGPANAYVTSCALPCVGTGSPVTIAGAVNSGNNGSFPVTASTGNSLTVTDSGGVAEAAPSGTASVVQGSKTVLWASGSLFTPAMVGNPFTINNSSVSYTVQTFNSSTSLTLTAAVTQPTATYSYVASTITASIPSNWLAPVSMTGTITAANLLWLGPAVPTITCSSPACASSTLYAFDSAAVGTSSDDSPTSPPAITVTSIGATLTGVSVTASANFSQTNTCDGTLAANASCTISPSFTPTATGNLTGTITFAWTNGGGGSTTINLSGTGLAAGGVCIIPQVPGDACNAAYNFASSPVGVASPDSPITPAVSNTNGAGLTSVSCSISGGTNPTDFALASPCPTTLANDAIFSMPGITFTPSTAGAESASLNVSYIGVSGGGGTTLNAASCSASDVQAKLNLVGSGVTTVVIPAGTCHWTTTDSLTVPSGSTSLTIQGATTVTCTGTAGTSGYSCTPTNNTVIVDDYTGSNNILTFTLNSTGFFRWTGMTINYGLTPGNGNANGELSFFGGGGGQQLRIDHSHFNSSASTYSAASPTLDSIDVQGCIFGVIDHNVFDNMNGASGNPSRNNIVVVRNGNGCGTDPNGFGDGAFASTVQFGSNQFLFMEANVYNIQTAPGGEGSAYVQIDDCWAGGKYVARYNNVNGGKFQTHATGANGPHRGCYAEELYGNYVNIPNGDGLNTVQYMSSGALLHWGNTITGTGWNSDVDLISTRSNNASYSQGTGGAGGWGYCGTAFNGTGSIWDASSSTSSGYPCLDQPGRGKSDLLSGTFSPATRQDNVYSAPHWPNQALTPLYVWENSCSGCSTPISNGYAGVFTENTDYYQDAGLNGVVDGTLAARPSTCTTGHAYWETDNLQLDFCNSTNVWSTLTSTPASYVPYTYPHPLISGGSGSVSAALSGTGVGASVTISPGSYAFADTVVTNTSTDSPLAVTITNNLSGSINVSSVSLGTANFTQSNSCSTIPAGSPPANQCVVMVYFTPLVTGALSDTLTVVYTGGGGGMLTSALSGNGLPQPPPSTGAISLPPGWPF